MLLNRVRIRARLGLGFAAVLSGVLVVAAVAALSLLGLGGQITQVGEQIYQRADALAAMERAIKDRDIALRDLASQDDPTVVLRRSSASSRRATSSRPCRSATRTPSPATPNCWPWPPRWTPRTSSSASQAMASL